jgi:hypothetical protein
MSKLTAEGLGGKLDVADLNVDNYHGNFVYHWGESDAKMRPFAMIGFGATHYSFGTVQVPGPGQGREIPGNTQFSTTWGGGVKFYATPTSASSSPRAGRRPTSRPMRPATGAIRSTAAGSSAIPTTPTSST